ncbi:enoyl-CoA hydratase/isomerase family protein [Dongia soli]|uniref:3-hydroxyisobutyryl-CoA hydrolase n=1 Tax=Dongia soli TaxID=600628 RepID=A0ABU5ECT8_9PROT|nr:enoyl-CoA hydratase/isomerase family protein [Dongia soli]MDY0883248.1 enoyl-CoA hydratase/isomerase family protein [Dongia soli]
MSDAIQISEAEGLGTITISRPFALNAFDLDMIQAADTQLRRWRQDDRIKAVMLRGDGFRSFSTGADLKVIHQAGAAGDQAALAAFLRAEYRLVHLFATYPKKTIALINGIVMGFGSGLAMAANIRVVSELSVFSSPECRIGLMPDLGAGLYLNRCPGKIGFFLGLTGMEIRAPGMLHAGLGTHLVPPERIDLLGAGNVDELAIQPSQIPLAAIQPEIDRCFGQRSLSEILTVLSSRSEQGFRDILGQIMRGSPLSLLLTFAHLTRAEGKPLEEVLKTEYRITRRLLRRPEPFEGIRAQFLEKDGAPRWQETQIGKIANSVIEEYFAPLSDEPELYFDGN